MTFYNQEIGYESVLPLYCIRLGLPCKHDNDDDVVATDIRSILPNIEHAKLLKFFLFVALFHGLMCE